MADAICPCSSVTVFVFLLGPSFCTPALSPVGQESASWHCSCGTLGVGLKRPSVSSLDSSVAGARVCPCMWTQSSCAVPFIVLFCNYVQNLIKSCYRVLFVWKHTHSIFQNYYGFKIRSCEITNYVPETWCNYMNSNYFTVRKCCYVLSRNVCHNK